MNIGLITKKVIKSIAPTRLTGFYIFLKQYYENTKRDEQITVKNRQKIDALLQSRVPINLELGAGENRGIAGWTYVDVNECCDLVLDLSQPIPFPDNTVSMIYSSHFLEHFTYAELVKLLDECRRVLKPGGIFNAAVPDARIYFDAYLHSEGFDPDVFCRYAPAFNNNAKIDFVNYIAYMDGHHKYMFDKENLLIILRKTGFNSVRLREFDKALDMEVRDFQTIYVLAEK